MADRHPHICLRALLLCCISLALLAPTAAHAAPPPSSMGGARYVPPPPPAKRAKIRDGIAIPPASAPRRVKRAIAAANRIVANKPYCYGGGHASWESRCYDCSGSVSYALGDRGAGVLEAPLPSGSFMRWGEPGKGRWISIYANGGHMYAVIAGLRLDTSMTDGDGPGWSRVSRDQAGFTIRHPRGL